MPSKPKTPPLTIPDRVMPYSPSAQKLWDETLEAWDLDQVATSILRCACESLSRSEAAAEVVSREGLTVLDRYGQTQKHPCTLLERDFREAAVRALNRLAQHLGG
jgi:phage terminase small subunit